jgi:hypothetical protein
VKQYLNVKAYAVIILIIGTLLLCACPGAPSQNFTPPPTSAEPAEPVEPLISEHTEKKPSDEVERVDVVYFHRPQRCTKCLCFEERVSYVIATYFQDEIDSGKLTFRILNLGDPENAEIASKYAAIGSQLFVNTIIDGKEHIQDIQEIWSWNCTGDEEQFDAQVRNVIEQSLAGTAG